MKFITAFFDRIKTFFSSLFSSRSETSLELGVITKRFNLLEEAKKLALLGLPAFHTKSLSSIELEVVRYIENAREQIQHQTVLDLERIDNVIKQTQASQHDIRAGVLTADFERKALLIFNEQNAWLEKLAGTARRRIQELSNFQNRHHLERDATYPDNSGLFFRYALLVLLVTFEGVFNASFFAEGLSTGLLGGFFYAVGLASINVLVAFVLGKSGVRWIFHSQMSMKALGGLVLAVTVAFTSTMALAIGHLRTAILEESISPTKDAWLALMSAPLGLDDMVAWVLFLVTIGFGLAAMIDGLFMDDLYPGYGALTRRTKLAIEEFEEEFEEFRAELEDVKQENIDALDDEIERAKNLPIKFRQQLEDKKEIYQSWMKTLNDSEVVLYAALRCFRSENLRHRNDALRPAYFDTLPTLRQVHIAQPDMKDEEKAYEEMLLKARELEQSLPSRRAKIYSLFDQHVQQLNFLKNPAHGT